MPFVVLTPLHPLDRFCYFTDCNSTKINDRHLKYEKLLLIKISNKTSTRSVIIAKVTANSVNNNHPTK